MARHMREKILIASFTFPPNKDGVAGAANSMATDLASQGYEIVVCTGFHEERAQLHPNSGIRVEEFSLDSSWQSNNRSQNEALRMQNLIVKESPDVIICQCWDIWATSITERTFPYLPRTRKILVSHGYSSLWKPSARFPWGIKGLLRSLMTLCSLPRTISKYDRIVFTTGKYDFHRFLDHTIAKIIRFPGIKIIPNSIDVANEKLASEKFKSWGAPQELVVMCVSNYFPGKNQELALRAFRRASIPDSVMVFIGSSFNDYSNHLMKLDAELSKSSSHGRVVFLENFSRAETLAAYRTADIFLFTSISETGPLVVLEALAAGVPFVSTRVGIVDQVPGGIVVNGEKQLADALVVLAANPAKRRQLGMAGRDEVLKRFSPSKVRESRIQMIRELLESH